MAEKISDFEKFRSEMNEEILNCGHLGMKRFFALDHHPTRAPRVRAHA